MLLHKALSRSHQEAFSRDSKLVQRVREDYYQENHPCLDCKISCNMGDIIWSMIKSTALLSSKIYKIKETWTGQSGTAICQLCSKNPAERADVLLPSVPIRVPKGHGPNCCPPSRCTLSFQWGNPLSVVWGRKDRMRELLSTTCGWCTTSWAWCVRSASTVPQSHQRPSGHIRGHLVPWPEELPAIHRRRPWQIIFIGLTTSTRLAASTFQRWDPGQRIRRRIQHLSDHHIGDTPAPSIWNWMEDRMEELPSINLMHAYHLQSSCIPPGLQ